MDAGETEKLAKKVLDNIYEENKNKGLLSIYLWGSIITPDFNPKTSDIDAVGILSDEADFEAFDKMRDWLPNAEPRLKRLQINFFYLSELQGQPQRSRLGRLHHAEQAVFDLPYWQYVCGQKLNKSDFPAATPAQVLKHQAALVNTRIGWVKNGVYGDMAPEYLCKSLAWLCYNIHKLDSSPSGFSWAGLKNESTAETKHLVDMLLALKAGYWDEQAIRKDMPELIKASEKLIRKYQ